MSKFTVILTKKAQKNLDKIRGKTYDQIYKIALDLSNNPFPVGAKHMIGVAPTQYRIRTGDYRIIYNVDTKKKLIYILKVGHRKDIYR